MSRGATSLALGSLAAIGGATWLFAGREASAIAESPVGSTPHHVRVVWTEDPQHAATIAWSTRDAGFAHRVRIAPESPVEATPPRSIEATRNGPYARLEGEAVLHYHHVVADGLAPATTYRFFVESDGITGRELRFTTAPADGRPIAVLAASDSRSDRAQRQEIDDRLRVLFETDPQVIGLLHGGDYVYDGTSLELFAAWMTDHERTITTDGRVLPIVPTRGNHESRGELFDQVFGWPGGGEPRNWYACRIAKDSLLLVLNTETAAGGDQALFVEETLARAHGARWLLASYHQPAFPAVKEPSAALQHWVPSFEKHGVDLVVESDGHVQKRTVPIRGGARDDQGVVYIGEGGAGVRQRSPDTERWFLQPPGFARSGHHVWRIGIAPDALRVTAILADGTISDEASIAPKQRR